MPVRLIHHVEFLVSNAIQASFWYAFVFGFQKFAEKRTRTQAILLFTSPNNPKEVLKNGLIGEHGDFVQNVAYEVDDIDQFLKAATENMLTLINQTETVQVGEGTFKWARIKGSAGEIIHDIVERKKLPDDFFLPGFEYVNNYEFHKNFSSLPVVNIDHVVEAHPAGEVDNIVDWYNRTLHFQRFWSIDDKQVHTEYSALKAALVANEMRTTKVTLVEPVPTEKKGRSQVQEFLDFHNGPGIQHIAFAVDDIISAVAEMRRRSVEFLEIPSSYYDHIEERLRNSSVKVVEDLKAIRENQLLIDFDEKGYLLQCFTKPVQPRPTFFVEIIRRHGFDGFGAGNFKALFEAVELEQKKRGTLFCDDQ